MRKQLWSGLVTAVLLIASGVLLGMTSTLHAASVRQDATPVAEPLTGMSPIASSGDWETVQASGVLTVGTSASSPPFAYYTPGFDIDGFDAVLMQAIADELGVKLVLVDYAFDGLPAALQVGQIDAVAAALTMTPERAKFVDFSMPYYLSAESILAPAGSPLTEIAINTQDFTNLRLGVQHGSVYETWAKEHLIDTGRMPATNLQVFAREQDIAQALREGRVDVGLMDLLPAQELLRQGGIKQIGSNQLLQQYAIAVRKGSSLLPQINAALTVLQQQGVLDKLHALYLAPDEAAPAPTPTPVPPAPACQDVSGYVADLTYADSDTAIPFVQPGQPFVKSWRLVNHGTCPWTSGYSLVYVPMPDSRPEDQMGGAPVPIKGVVQPGQTVDLSANLVAPTTPGMYKGVWQMVNAAGQPFGQRIWVRIQVPGGAPTPQPTSTPTQGINFTVDRTSIRSGQCVNFRWDVTKVAAVFFYRSGEDYTKHGVAGQSGQQVCPQSTTTYNLRVDKLDGSSATAAITIYVARDPDAPYVQYFTSNPTKINTGQCTTLSWQVTGQINGVTIKRNGGSWWAGAPTGGSQQDCPKNAGDYAYELVATGPGGTAAAAAQLSVFDKPVPAPTPTPFNPAPVPAVIDYFTLDTTQIMPDQCVSASWSVGAGVTSVNVLIDDSPAARGVSFVSSQQFCPQSNPGDTLKFTLSAQGMAGTNPDVRDVYVSVLQPAPEPTATPEPPPTPAPEPPVIANFFADRTEIYAGECVGLSWSVGGWVDAVQLYRNGSYLYDVSADDSRDECLSDPGSYDYRLRAVNSAGLEDSRDVSVDVVFMPAPEPTDDPWPVPTDDPQPEPDPNDDPFLGG